MYIYVYIYIHIYVFTYSYIYREIESVCVCGRERGTERERETDRNRPGHAGSGWWRCGRLPCSCTRPALRAGACGHRLGFRVQCSLLKVQGKGSRVEG